MLSLYQLLRDICIRILLVITKPRIHEQKLPLCPSFDKKKMASAKNLRSN